MSRITNGYELILIRPVNITLSLCSLHCDALAERAAMATVATTHQIRAVRRFKPPAAAVKRVYLPHPLHLLPRNLHGLSGASSLLCIQPRPFLRPLSATGVSGQVTAFHLEEILCMFDYYCYQRV